MISVSMCAKMVLGGRSPTLAISIPAVVAKQCRRRTAMMTLDAFCFRNWCAQTDCQIVSEMIAANGHSASVANYASAVDDEPGCAAADVEHAAAQIALILGEARLRGGERLEDRVVD